MRQSLRWIPALLLTLPLAAWGGQREAELALARASSSVAAAQRAGADEFARDPLATSHAALAQAERACLARAWLDCEHAAERAQADARLAEARTRQLRAEANTERLATALNALRDELSFRGG